MSPYVDAIDDSVHTSVSCYRCHTDSVWSLTQQKNNEVTHMYPAALLGQGEVESPASPVTSAPCRDCHSAIFENLTVKDGLSISHADCVRPGDSCSACHTAALHGNASRWIRQPVMEDCVACHVDEGASTDCDTCHEGRLETERLAEGPWQVTHGRNWRETHGAGTISACVTCHEPEYCADCHGVPLPHEVGFGDTHGGDAIENREACESCHDPVAFCNECHRVPMPHPDTFLEEHPTIADGYEDESCLDCHVKRDCDNCHVLHTHPGSTDGTIGEFRELTP